MKCIVLAGGSSERLWPLSRKEYPKQFMELREGRSMFQETILRNMPFCDEFIILTNKIYENVARGQLQAFQGVEFRLVLEDEALKTAPPVILILSSCADDEDILIVTTDSIINGDYNASISLVKDGIKDNKFAVITVQPNGVNRQFNYISCGKTHVTFGAKPSKSHIWDTGIWGARAGVLKKAFDKDLVERCKRLTLKNNIVKKTDNKYFEPVSLIKAIAPKDTKVIEATFEWIRITDISSFYKYYEKAVANDKNTIYNNSSNVEIVNMVDDQLIIANGIKNAVIVNTSDAIYVTTSADEADIKGITNKYYSTKSKYFDIQPKKYESWGISELIGSANNCSVKLITLYQKKSVSFKVENNSVANLFITQGCASLLTKNEKTDYAKNQNITLINSGDYTLQNIGKDDLTVVYTVKTEKNKRVKKSRTEYLVKMLPTFKDNLWGGTKIRDVFGKDVNGMDIVAESWELSAHPAGQSKVAFGSVSGKTLTEYIDYIGKDRLGWKAQTYDKFPIMVKFIDAKQSLSIQVHPADDYAMEVEGEYGKNEMWHIVDADENAFIYVGFNKNVTKQEIRERIENNTLIDILNKIPVKKGETYFLKAGTVHAIGAGCFICEIQQSSNVTYRLYDYGRKDKNGNLRELHIDKALDVLDLNAYSAEKFDSRNEVVGTEYKKAMIGQCKYFTVNKYFVDGECVLPSNDLSFQSIIVLNGECEISDGDNEYKTLAGDTWFVANKVKVTLRGKVELLVVNV